MPKKFAGENTKAVAARERKLDAKKAELDKKQRAAEDAYWADDDKQIARKQQRKEEEERKRLETLKRKEENKKLYEEELQGISKAGSAQKPTAKVTRAQLAARAEAMMKAAADLERQRQMETDRVKEVDHLDDTINNRETEVASARNVEEAIEALGVDDVTESPDKHPEKRMRAAYLAFEETRLPQLKSENPGFRLSQLKQALRKEWAKHPQNPLNQKSLRVHETGFGL